MSPNATSERDHTLDGLRGLAAMAVVLHHLIGTQNPYGDQRVVNWLSYGALGVDVFFVISGFIIPSLLLKSTFSGRQVLRFMLRRLIRLLPPYWVAVLVSVASLYLAGTALDYGADRPAVWLCHLTQACGNLKIPWWNGVFWSLPVEIQFYGLAAVLVPLALALDRRWRFALGALMLLAAVRSPDSMAFQYAPLFLSGIVALAWREKGLSRWQLCVCVLAIIASHYFAFGFRPLAVGVALLTAWLLVASPRWLALFSGLGLVSYSLYLLHVPIGYRVVEFGMAQVSTPSFLSSTLIALLAIAASILAAIGFYALVERPAMYWARRIKF